MLWVSFLTTPLGLSEPIFVPGYWTPPTLFNLANTYRLDLESFIFSFAIGGVASVIYETLNGRKKKMAEREKQLKRHEFHRLAVLSPLPVFAFFYLVTPINPIYSTIIALMAGVVATKFCRPDLKSVMVKAAIIFAVVYFLVFLVTFVILFPRLCDACLETGRPFWDTGSGCSSGGVVICGRPGGNVEQSL